MEQFEVGDTVQLKSGGPLMTITARNSKGEFVCHWFVPVAAQFDNVHKEPFPAAALKKAK